MKKMKKLVLKRETIKNLLTVKNVHAGRRKDDATDCGHCETCDIEMPSCLKCDGYNWM